MSNSEFDSFVTPSHHPNCRCTIGVLDVGLGAFVGRGCCCGTVDADGLSVSFLASIPSSIDEPFNASIPSSQPATVAAGVEQVVTFTTIGELIGNGKEITVNIKLDTSKLSESLNRLAQSASRRNSQRHDRSEDRWRAAHTNVQVYFPDARQADSASRFQPAPPARSRTSRLTAHWGT